MIRREALMGLGGGLISGALLGNLSHAMEEPHAHEGSHAKLSALGHAAREAAACAIICEECYAHCQKMVYDGMKEHVASAAACLDCADICSLTSRVFSRNGAMTSLVRDVCIQACTACALECEKTPEHAIMKECAEVCRKCIAACKGLKED